jgi:serine/threonine-protein kinase
MSNGMPPVLKPGDLIAETYEVERLIGRGGMGEVWLATHRRLPGKRVAIKILHNTAVGLSDESMKRFKREAEIASRIGHPNIVEVHDFNLLPGGTPYLVLEYLVGESLASRLRHGALPLEQTKTIIYQVGSALAATHSHGVVHRDLKPDNIFLITSPIGERVKVLDFGISKIQDSQTVQTMESALVGTPQYMAPEQALGQNKDISGQTDVFALGAITYEMLSGQPAFSGDNIAKLVFNVAYQPHTPIAQLCPGLPARERDAIEHALVKDKAQRTPTIQAFIEAFTRQTLTVSEKAPGAPDPLLGGIATPGIESSESLMMAKTAAPQPPSQKATPAISAQPLATPTVVKKSSTPLYAGLAAVVLIAIGGYLAFGTGKIPPAPGGGPVALLPPQFSPTPAPVDAGSAAAAVEVTADARNPTTGEKAVKAPKALSPADKARLASAQEALKNEQWSEAARLAIAALPDLSSGAESRAHAIAAKAFCGQHDLQNVRTRCNKVTGDALQAEVEKFCRRKGMNVVCRP